MEAAVGIKYNKSDCLDEEVGVWEWEGMKESRERLF